RTATPARRVPKHSATCSRRGISRREISGREIPLCIVRVPEVFIGVLSCRTVVLRRTARPLRYPGPAVTPGDMWPGTCDRGYRAAARTGTTRIRRISTEYGRSDRRGRDHR